VVAPVDLAENTIIGVKVYATERELPGLFEKWQGLGINTVFSGEELAATGGFRALARSRDFDLFVIFPVFFAPDLLAEEPGLWAVTAEGEPAKEDWVEFVCPSRPEFRNRRVKEAIGIVKRLRPDGLSIDFIRHFVYWEMVGPDRDPATLPETCYCVHCLQGFATFLGVPALSIPPQPEKASAWIETNAADAWVRFKAQTITAMAADIAEAARAVDPEIMINVHMVPWRRRGLSLADDLLLHAPSPAGVDHLGGPGSRLAGGLPDLAERSGCPGLPRGRSIHCGRVRGRPARRPRTALRRGRLLVMGPHRGGSRASCCDSESGRRWR
jgi:hypothetical protein